MKTEKKQIIIEVAVVFILCSIVKTVEFLFIRTDSTFIGENVICKIFMIIATLVMLKRFGYKLSDIGFKNSKVLKYAACGLTLGVFTFAVSYGVEYLILLLQGQNPHLSMYITNFGLTGATTEMKLTLGSLVICMLGNVINVLAEEGLFRGFLLRSVSAGYGFKRGNFIQAFLFGVWHIVSCIQGLYDGTMTLPQAIVYAIGYVVLATILGLEWGLCVNMTGILWVGMFEHFFNNFISNALHMVCITNGVADADSMQILRIVLSNVLSLTIVLLINKRKAKKANTEMSQ